MKKKPPAEIIATEPREKLLRDLANMCPPNVHHKIDPDQKPEPFGDAAPSYTRGRIGHGDELDDVHPDFQLQAAEELWQLRADNEQLSDVDAVIWAHYLKMQDRLRKADNPKRDPGHDLIKANAIYSVHVLNMERRTAGKEDPADISIYRDALELIERAKRGYSFASHVPLPSALGLKDWYKRRKRENTLPPYSSSFINFFLKIASKKT